MNNDDEMKIQEDLYGSKGGKGGGGGARTPVEDPDTLRSTNVVTIVDLISEGPIKGVVGRLKGTYLDESPVQDEHGTFAYEGVSMQERHGYPDQDILPGLHGTSREVSIGAELIPETPQIHTVSDPDVDEITVRVQTPRLTKTDKETGDISGYSLSFIVDVKKDDGIWNTIYSGNIKGKTTSAYQKSFNIPLPKPSTAWDVRVTKQGDSRGDSTVADSLQWVSVTEHINAKLTYPDSALVKIEADAQQFGSSVPTRSYLVDGRIIRVPSNYSPETREYSGIWDGTFKVAWTDNPAWVYYDILTNSRFGAGEKSVDKWALYEISKYCDELVPDGYGGWEPRFTCNLVLNTQKDAFEAIDEISSIFRGMTYWASNHVMPVADMPKSVKRVFSPANVVGDFEYSSTSRSTRHSAILVTYNDPDNYGKKSVEVVESPEMIERFGWRKKDVTALGCTSRGQAHRLGKWILYTEQFENETLSFTSGTEAFDLAPGDIIDVHDPAFAGGRFSGRVMSCTTSWIDVDELPEGAAPGWSVDVTLPSQAIEARQIGSVDGRRLHFTSPLSSQPIDGAIWSLRSTEIVPQTYRVLSVSEGEDSMSFDITCLKHYPGKFDYVEDGKPLPDRPESTIPSGTIGEPGNLSAEPVSYVAGGTRHQGMQVSWTPSDDPRVHQHQLEVQAPDEVTWETVYTGPGVSFRVNDAEGGQWRARVRSVSKLGAVSRWVSDTFNMAGLLKPLPPTGVQYEAGVFSIKIYPEGRTPGSEWEFRRSLEPLDATQITVSGVHAGTGTYLVDDNLRPDTIYYYYIRGVNVYGHSEWYPFQVATTGDVGDILDALEGQIKEGQLWGSLNKRIDLIDAPSSVAGSVEDRISTAKGSLQSNLDSVDARLSEEISQLDESVSTGFTSVGDKVQGVRDALNSASTELSGRIDGVDTRVTQVSEDLSSSLASVDGRVDVVSQSLLDTEESLQSSVDSVQLQADTVRTDLGSLSRYTSDQVSSLESDISRIETESDTSVLSARVDGVQDQLDYTTTNLENADAQLDSRLSDISGDLVDSVERLEEGDRFSLSQVQGVRKDVGSLQGSILDMRRVAEEEDLLDAVDYHRVEALSSTGDATVRTEEQARVDGDSALAYRADQIEASVGDTNARITSEGQARVDGDSALSSRIGELSAKLDSLPTFGSGFEDGADISQWSTGVDDSVTVVTDDVYVGTQSALLTSGAPSPAPGDVVTADIPSGAADAFNGYEIVARIAAKQPSINASNEFALAYSKGDGTSSGWQKFAPTTNWEVHEFRWTVPEGASSNPDFISIWGDTSGSGLGVLLGAVKVQRANAEITEITSSITEEQKARADADAALSSDLTALNSRMGDAESDIIEERNTRSSETSTLSSDLTALNSRMGDAESDIIEERNTRSSETSALSSSVSSLTSKVGDVESSVDKESATRAEEDEAMAWDIAGIRTDTDENTAGLSEERTARTTEDEAQAADIYNLNAALGDTQAALSTEEQTRASETDALASRASQLETDAADNAASITSEEQTRASETDALASRASQLETDAADNAASITSEEQTRSDETSALASRADMLETRATNSESDILRIEETVSDEASATSRVVDSMRSEFGGQEARYDSITRTMAEQDLLSTVQTRALESHTENSNARIATEEVVRSSETEALASRASTLETDVADNKAAITSEEQTRSDETSALASRASQLETDVANNTSAITEEQTARSDLESSTAASLLEIQSEVDNNAASITSEEQTRSDETSALASRASQLESDVANNAASITSEEQTRSDETSALAESISSTRASLDAEVESLRDGDEGIRSKLSAQTARMDRSRAEDDLLEALQFHVVETKGAASRSSIKTEEIARQEQGTAFSMRMDSIESEVGNNKAYITSVERTQSDDYSALSSRISELSAKVDDMPTFSSGFEEGADFDQWVVRNTDTLTAYTADPFVGTQSSLLSSTASSPVSTNRTGVTHAAIPSGATDVFEGKRITVQVAAKQPDNNASSEFAVAYATASVGNSRWQKFSPTTVWQVFEFEYDVPEGSNDTTDYIGIWADTSGSGLGVVIDSVQVKLVPKEILEITAAIEEEQRVRADADEAISSDVSSLTSRMGDAESAISTESQARVDGDSALSSRIDTVESEFGSATALLGDSLETLSKSNNAVTKRVSTNESSIEGVSGRLDSEITTRADETSALSSDVRSLGTDLGSANSRIASEEKTRASKDEALSSQISTTKSELGDQIASTFDMVEARAAGQTLVRNPLFATGDKSGWGGWGGTEVVLNAQDSGVEYALKWPNTGHDAVRHVTGEWMPVSSGDIFQLYCRFRSLSAGFRMAIQWINNESNIFHSDTGPVVTGGWEEYPRQSFPAPEGATRARVLLTRMSGGSGQTFASNIRAFRRDSAAVEKISQIESEVGDAKSSITSLEKTVSDNDKAVSTRVDGVESSLGSVDSRLTEKTDTLASDLSGVTSQVDTLSSTVSGNSSRITSISKAQTSDKKSLASRITGVESKLGDDVASLQSSMETKIEGIEKEVSTSTSGADLVVNGKFNLGTKGWLTQGHGVVDAVERSGYVPSQYAFKLPSGGEYAHIRSEKVPFVAGEKVYVSAEVTATGKADNKIRLILQCIDGRGNHITHKLANLENTTWSWKTITHVFTAPEGTQEIRVGVHRPAQRNVDIGAVGGVQFTNVRAFRVDPILSSEYNLKLDVNGHVTGLGMYNDGKTSDFSIRADRFYIAEPGANGTHTPFVVRGGTTYIRDVMIHDASISSAKITNGSITNAKIADGHVTRAKIGNAAINNAKIANASVDTLKIRGNSVTVPVGVSAGSLTYSHGNLPAGSWSRLLTGGFRCSGQPVMVTCAANCLPRSNWRDYGYGRTNFHVRLVRIKNGRKVSLGNFYLGYVLVFKSYAFAVGLGAMSMAVKDHPGKGKVHYALEGSRQSTNGQWVTMEVRSRSLTFMEVKR